MEQRWNDRILTRKTPDYGQENLSGFQLVYQKPNIFWPGIEISSPLCEVRDRY